MPVRLTVHVFATNTFLFATHTPAHLDGLPGGIQLVNVATLLLTKSSFVYSTGESNQTVWPSEFV